MFVHWACWCIMLARIIQGKRLKPLPKIKKMGKFEKEQFSNLKEAHPEAETQVSVKPMDSNGNAMRNGGNYLDGIALDSDGNHFIEEYKASQTAPYTSNQKANGFDTGALNKDYNVPLVKTQRKKIIVTAKTLYSHPKNVSKIYAALHTDLAW